MKTDLKTFAVPKLARAVLIGAALAAALVLGGCTALPSPAASPAPTEAPAATLSPAETPTGAPATAAPTAAISTTEPATPAPTAAATAAAYDDPFAYCAAVTTIDAPDARYTGPKIPEAVVNGLQQALGLTGTPAPPITQNSFWRCMSGKVYACTVGANLPCQSKANTDKTPNEGMTNFCKDQPNADVIPMFATGHDTIYEWRCKDGKAEVVKQIAEVDAQGFQKNIWYEIQP